MNKLIQFPIHLPSSTNNCDPWLKIEINSYFQFSIINLLSISIYSTYHHKTFWDFDFKGGGILILLMVNFNILRSGAFEVDFNRESCLCLFHILSAH